VKNLDVQKYKSKNKNELIELIKTTDIKFIYLLELVIFH
jgi:hypothetical protein